MKVVIPFLHLLACLGLSSAFTSPLAAKRVASFASRTSGVNINSKSHLYMSSQWDDDDEDDDDAAPTIKQKSFDDAGDTLRNEEDSERLNEMGDYDANPEVRAVHYACENKSRCDAPSIALLTSCILG